MPQDGDFKITKSHLVREAKVSGRIELVGGFQGIGKGQAGWRDDVLNYHPSDAGI